MQLIIPEIPIRISSITLLHARLLIHRAVVLISPDTLPPTPHARPVEIFRRIYVDIRDEGVGVKHGKVSHWVAIGHFDFIGCLVFEDIVDARGELAHRVCDFRVVGRFVGPVLVCADAVVGVVRVKRGQVQGNGVHEHEVAGALKVEFVKDGVDAVGVVGEDFSGEFAVGEEGGDAEVVGADPEGVDGVLSGGLGVV